MTEFDLVSHEKTAPLDRLNLHWDLFQGTSAQSVLECRFGTPSWDQRLKPSEIPGWLELGKVSSENSAWEIVTESEFRWSGQTLFSLTSATRSTTRLEELDGLLARSGDQLPAGDDSITELHFRLLPNTNLYGLGQRSGPLERGGLRCVNWTTDSPVGHNRVTDPLYQAHPLLWGVTEDIWWAMLFCHTGYSSFDLAQSHPGSLKIRLLADSSVVRIHAGRSPRELLGSLRQTLVDPTPPPLWSLGFHQSRWGYRSADEIDDLIASFREKELPLDAVHLDIDHMDGYRSFSFNPDHFPQPKQRFQSWKEQGVRVVTIIDPGLKFDTSGKYKPVQEGLKGDHFIRSTSGAPVVGFCWPDEALFPDFTRQRTRDWWALQCRYYLDHGVSGLWIDMNEPAIFDRPFWSGKAKQEPMPLDTPWGEDSKRLNHLNLRNLYGSFMSQATRSAWETRQERPWVLTRAGFTGVGAEAWSWMGDNTSWWEHLALSLPQLSSMALVNSAFVGVDIGGFFGNADSNLYSAWMEASPIYPFMRAHSALGTLEQHPWSHGPEVEEVARQALQLRYRLLPYIYSAAMEYCQGGLPLLRPMFFDYPHIPEFRFLEDQVLFGPHMIAAPFVVRGLEQRKVVLPAGDWYDFHSGQAIRSNGEGFVIRRNPGKVPLFVKAGAVIATLEGRLASTSEAHSSDWELRHFPGQESVSSTVFWDRGDGWAFRGGDCLKLTAVNENQQLRFSFEHLAERYGSIKVRISTPDAQDPPTTFEELSKP